MLIDIEGAVCLFTDDFGMFTDKCVTKVPLRVYLLGNREKESSMFKNVDIKVYIGVAVIFAGVVMFLDNIGLDLGVDLFDFWPLILIVIGLNYITSGKQGGRSTNGWLFIAFGILFLLRSFDIIWFSIGQLWPLVLIAIGFSILRNHAQSAMPEGSDSADFINLLFILGGGEHKYTSKSLRGGRITAVMGGGTIDLRRADTRQEVLEIEVFAMWGGIEIIVPFHWQVNIKGAPLLGAMENNTNPPEAIEGLEVSAPPRSLVITGSAIMGGVEVKN